jgi:hypothetical protein
MVWAKVLCEAITLSHLVLIHSSRIFSGDIDRASVQKGIVPKQDLH